MARLAVVGSGAVGQFYGAQFALAGHDVAFVARRDAPAIAVRGVLVEQRPTPDIASSSQPRLHLPPGRVAVAANGSGLAGWGVADWLLVTLKATALGEVARLAGPLIGPGTRIIVACNGYGVEEALLGQAAPERIFGLLLFVCVNRDDDGTIRHLEHGAVAGGHLLGDAQETAALLDLCRSAGIRVEDIPTLVEARWRKLVWNIPFNGLAIAGGTPGRTTDLILADPQLAAQARRLMDELIVLANADLAAHRLAGGIEAGWAVVQMERTPAMGSYAPSTLLDLRYGLPMELDAIFLAPQRRARALAVATPELDLLVGRLPVGL